VAASSWDRWRGEIAKACDGSHHTVESIEASLSEGRSHLLDAGDCCFIVEVCDYPQARACQVMWAAGNLPAIIAALPDLEAWAKLQGCTEILEEGHPGWGRVLQREGWERWSVTMRKAL